MFYRLLAELGATVAVSACDWDDVDGDSALSYLGTEYPPALSFRVVELPCRGRGGPSYKGNGKCRPQHEVAPGWTVQLREIKTAKPGAFSLSYSHHTRAIRFCRGMRRQWAWG
jgi:hypothetical protein